jgi:hypothetical protein
LHIHSLHALAPPPSVFVPGAPPSLPGGKKLQLTWKLVLGEAAVQVQLTAGTSYTGEEQGTGLHFETGHGDTGGSRIMDVGVGGGVESR